MKEKLKKYLHIVNLNGKLERERGGKVGEREGERDEWKGGRMSERGERGREKEQETEGEGGREEKEKCEKYTSHPLLIQFIYNRHLYNIYNIYK